MVHFSNMDAGDTITGRNVITKTLYSCFNGKPSSLKEQLEYILSCEMSYLKHCTGTPFRANIFFNYERSPFCGNIHIRRGGASINTKLSLKVMEKHVLKFNFIIFNFHRTFEVCGPDNLHLTDHFLDTTGVYCGLRMPWTMLSAGEWCNIIIDISSMLTSTMKLFYQTVHRHLIRRVSVSNWLNLGGPITNVFIDKTVSHSISFTVFPYQTILTQVNWIDDLAANTVLVFDGPGQFSPVMFHLQHGTPTDVYNVTSSAFNTYILISHQINKYDSTILNLHATISTRTRKCNSTYIVSQNTEFLAEHSFDTRHNFICMFKYSASTTAFPLIYFTNFIFKGPDTIESVHMYGCSYGGIFIDVGVMDTKSSYYMDRAVCKSSKDFVVYSGVHKLNLLVIWFQGYSSGIFEGRVQDRNCPTSYISLHTQLPYFSGQCHYYVCQGEECAVRLRKYNTSFGPSILRIAKAEDLEVLPLKIKLPFICRTEFTVKTFWSKQWIIDKTVYTTQYRRRSVSSDFYLYIESYDFLHNCTSHIKTCYQSPLGIALTIRQCKNKLFSENKIVNGGVLNLYHACEMNPTEEITWYYLEQKNQEIFIRIKRLYRCRDGCSNRTIIIHEAFPDEQIVYRYAYAFPPDEFIWQAHKNQGGFSVTILPEENCLPRGYCLYTVSTQLTQPTSGTYNHAKYDYELLPQG